MPTQKILCDLDVGGEVKGTSLDINGNGDISGNLTGLDKVTSDKLTINTSTEMFSSVATFNGDTYTTGGYKIGTSGTYVGKIYNSSGVFSIETDGNRDVKIGSSNNTDVITVDTSALSTTFAGAITVSDGAHTGLTITGSGTSHTQGAILLKSGTSDTPEARGQGVFLFNEGDDATWYTGTQYQDADTWMVARIAGTSFDSSAATNAQSFFKISNAGNATFAGDITCGDDLFMPSAGVINFNSGDMLITHSSNKLSISGGTTSITALELGQTDHVIEDGSNILDENDNTMMSFASGVANITGNAATATALTSGNKTIQGVLSITGDGSNAATLTESGSGDFEVHAQDDLRLNAGGHDIVLKGASNEFGRLTNSSQDFVIQNTTSNKDIIFKGNDGGVTRTVLTLDISEAGKATFNNDVVAFSDRKLKENIETLDGKKVLDMRGVSFTRKDTGLPSSGVIAQEIQEVAPELVNETNGTLGVSYGNLVGYLIEAVKDQQKQIDELKEIINGSSR